MNESTHNDEVSILANRETAIPLNESSDISVTNVGEVNQCNTTPEEPGFASEAFAENVEDEGDTATTLLAFPAAFAPENAEDDSSTTATDLLGFSPASASEDEELEADTAFAGQSSPSVVVVGPSTVDASTQSKIPNIRILPPQTADRALLSSVFFRDHTRRLAVMHYKSPTITPLAVPTFMVPIYIQCRGLSFFNSIKDVKTILLWCNQIRELAAFHHLLRVLALPKNSIRFELYDSLDNFQEIINHSRLEREHRSLYRSVLDQQKVIGTAKEDIEHENLNAHHSNVEIQHAVDQHRHFEKLLADIETTHVRPTALAAHPDRLPGSMVPPPRPAAASATLAQVPKGSAPKPFDRCSTPIGPSSFFRGAAQQPYHQFALVLDYENWSRQGLVVLKFDRERDWAEANAEEEEEKGEGEEGEYVAERVAPLSDGLVLEQGGRLARKRWLGEILLEIVGDLAGLGGSVSAP